MARTKVWQKNNKIMKDIKFKSFTKPEIKIIAKEGEKHLWDKFAPHHYMDHNLPQSCVFYTFYWIKDDEEILVGCLGVLFQIAKNLQAKRFTRIVVLPEYQGLGFASKMINTISKYYFDEGLQRMYLSTFHPRLGEYMTKSSNWASSFNNMKEFRTSEDADKGAMKGLRDGVAMYRFNFIGCAKYNLLYNPIQITAHKKELRILQDQKRKETKEYKKLLAELKKLSPEPIKEIFEPEECLQVTNERHIKQKEEHKKLFNKNKRKVLTAEERKARKAKLKESKEPKNKKEGLDNDEW